MEILSVSKLLLFILFFIPGFISIKVYDLLIAGERRNFSSGAVEAIAFSAINYGLLSWLIWLIYKYNLYQQDILFCTLSMAILVICPMLWPIIYIQLLRWKKLSKYIIPPIRRPWDWFFNQKLPVWVIVTLTDGRKIGGTFFDSSFASSFPQPEQLYLEEIWELDQDNKFVKPILKSKGVIILGKDMSTVEFFTNSEVNKQ